MSNPEELYYRALEVLPQEIGDEIVQNKPELKSATPIADIYNFIHRKYLHQKHLAQQRLLVQSRTRRSHMSEISEVKNPTVNEIVEKTIAAFQRKQGSAQGPKPPRAASQSPKAKAKPKPGQFWFEPDCWWCGKIGTNGRNAMTTHWPLRRTVAIARA